MEHLLLASRAGTGEGREDPESCFDAHAKGHIDGGLQQRRRGGCVWVLFDHHLIKDIDIEKKIDSPVLFSTLLSSSLNTTTATVNTSSSSSLYSKSLAHPHPPTHTTHHPTCLPHHKSASPAGRRSSPSTKSPTRRGPAPRSSSTSPRSGPTAATGNATAAAASSSSSR